MLALRLMASGLKSFSTLTTTHIGGWLKLTRTAHAGNVPMVKALLRSRPTLQDVNSLRSIWHAVAEQGSGTALQTLWTAGEDYPALRSLVDSPNSRGESPLMLALKRGHGDAAVWLLKQGASPCRWDKHRRCSTFHFAARGGSEVACAAMLSRLSGSVRRAWANAGSSQCHVRPIHYAAAFGHARVVRLLLLNGALPNLTFTLWGPRKMSQDGHAAEDFHSKLGSLTTGTSATALHLAARNGHAAAAVEILHHFHINPASVADPRTLVHSPSAANPPFWRGTSSELAASYGHTALAALTHPSSDLSVLLAEREACFDVPSLASLAGAVLHRSLVTGIDAVKGDLCGGSLRGRKGGRAQQLAGSGGSGKYRGGRSSLDSRRSLGSSHAFSSALSSLGSSNLGSLGSSTLSSLGSSNLGGHASCGALNALGSRSSLGGSHASSATLSSLGSSNLGSSNLGSSNLGNRLGSSNLGNSMGSSNLGTLTPLSNLSNLGSGNLGNSLYAIHSVSGPLSSLGNRSGHSSSGQLSTLGSTSSLCGVYPTRNASGFCGKGAVGPCEGDGGGAGEDDGVSRGSRFGGPGVMGPGSVLWVPGAAMGSREAFDGCSLEVVAVADAEFGDGQGQAGEDEDENEEDRVEEEEEEEVGVDEEDEDQSCCVCLCSAVELQVVGCRHRMCCDCMREMADRAVKRVLLCPMCRGPVRGVEQLGGK